MYLVYQNINNALNIYKLFNVQNLFFDITTIKDINRRQNIYD